MFELRIYITGNPPTISHHVNAMVPLNIVAQDAAANGGFNFTRAECWYKGERQWELIID